MNAIDLAGRGHAPGVEEMAAQSQTDFPIGIREPRTPQLRSRELRRACPFGRVNWRRAYYKNGRDWHSRFDRRSPDFRDQRSNSLCRRPGIVVGMRELKIIRSQHHDDQSKRRMYLDSLSQALKSVPARLERIVPDCASSVQAVLNDPHSLFTDIQPVFQNARPALFERQPPTSIWNDAPGQGVRVNENLLHKRSASSAAIFKSDDAP